MKHEEPRWNPATSEWFCVRCGRTCDHLTKQDAQVELEQFECSLPSGNAVLHTGKEEGVAQLVSKRSRQEYRVAYRLEQITDEPHLAPTSPIITLLETLEATAIPDAGRNESTKSLQAEVMLTGHGDGGVFERPWTKAYRRCFSTVQPAEIGVTSVTVLERELPENA